jgi:hypothetical protein
MNTNNTICECAIEKLFLKPFSSLNFDKKKSIIKSGRPTPKLSNLTTKSKNYVRTFKYEYYSIYK